MRPVATAVPFLPRVPRAPLPTTLTIAELDDAQTTALPSDVLVGPLNLPLIPRAPALAYATARGWCPVAVDRLTKTELELAESINPLAKILALRGPNPIAMARLLNRL